MAISFQLNLTPNQIEFLQTLALYADGVIPVGDVADYHNGRSQFITYVRKMMREGLVDHVKPGPNQRYEGSIGGNEIIRAYRITDKGRSVLALIESDVEAFIERQKAYRKMKAEKDKAERRTA
jgi:hypothetical protein